MSDNIVIILIDMIPTAISLSKMLSTTIPFVSTWRVRDGISTANCTASSVREYKSLKLNCYRYVPCVGLQYFRGNQMRLPEVNFQDSERSIIIRLMLSFFAFE